MHKQFDAAKLTNLINAGDAAYAAVIEGINELKAVDPDYGIDPRNDAYAAYVDGWSDGHYDAYNPPHLSYSNDENDYVWTSQDQE